MIHHRKGLIAENENENIAAGERDCLPLVLEFQSADPRIINPKRIRGTVSPV